MGSTKTQPKPSSETNSPEFETRDKLFLHTTTIYLLNPPTTATTTTPFITAAVNNTNKLQLRHPLTLNHHTHHHTLPPNFNLSKLNPTTLTISHHSSAFDKILVFPFNDALNECTLIGLSAGGKLRGLPPHSNNWVSLSRDGDTQLFDDVVVYKDKVYVVDRKGMISTVNFCNSSKMKVGKALVDSPVPKWARRFEWRKRLVVDEKYLYVVVRTDEKMFRVFKVGSHSEVGYFVYKKLLFVTRDCYFFYEGEGLLRCGNYMVYSDGAFPRYGDDCWEFGKQEFRVFELGGVSYGKHDINEDFRKLDWSPPAWVLDAWLSVAADSQSRSLSDREPEEGVGFNSNCRDEKDQDMQSDLKDSNSKYEKDEEMRCDLKDSNNEDDKDEEMQSDLKDSNSKDGKDEEMQADLKDSNSKDDKDEEMQSDLNDTNSKDGKDEEMQADLKDLNSEDGKDGEMQADLKDSNSEDDKDEEMQSDVKDSNGKDGKDEEMQSDLKDSNNKDDKVEEMQADLKDSNGKDGKDEEMQADLKDSNNKDDKDEEMQSDLKDSNNKDENDEERQSDLIGQDKEQEGMDLNSNSQVHDDENMACDFNSQENEGEGVTRSLCSMDGGNDATDQVYVAGTSMETPTESMPDASCTTKSHKSDSVTSKFEGFDIRLDLIPTLQAIWQKHGNIIENSTIRSGDIIAKALESLAIMVRILEDNTSQSLSDCQADYLTLTLSDLRCISFKVQWLIPFVETAVNVHKSKGLLDSLNNLSRLSSQVKERRSILFDELAKLSEMEIKLGEEMTKVSKVIPFSGKVKLGEPLGLGIT